MVGRGWLVALAYCEEAPRPRVDTDVVRRLFMCVGRTRDVWMNGWGGLRRSRPGVYANTCGRKMRFGRLRCTHHVFGDKLLGVRVGSKRLRVEFSRRLGIVCSPLVCWSSPLPLLWYLLSFSVPVLALFVSLLVLHTREKDCERHFVPAVF